MRPYNDRPHTQLGFILNLNQHWFTLRRFGQASPNPDEDQGLGHWFNLDSALEGPQWVGNLYLTMVIQQAEQDGYSVFVVRQTDINGPLALPRTEADELAAQLSEPMSSRPDSTSQDTAHSMEDFEDEDMDLQQALQASLAIEGHRPPLSSSPHSEFNLESSLPLPVPPPLMTRESRRWRPMASGAQTPVQLPILRSGSDDISGPSSGDVSPVHDDPVAASLARNRSIMERMRIEQEMALRDNYQDVDMQEVSRRRREHEEEEEMVRQAIAESEALHQQEQHPRQAELVGQNTTVEGEIGPFPQPPYAPTSSGSAHRVYDDEDAELQAALRASLEDVPEGYQIPDSPPPMMIPPLHQLVERPPVPETMARTSSMGTDTGDSEMESETLSIASPEDEQISMEEMRRRRLARFGMS